MKILVVCQWFPPEYAPIGVMLHELAQDLAENGYEVTIITGFPNHPSGIVFGGYRKQLFLEERVGNVRIIRCYLYTSPRKTFLRRVMNYLTFAAASFWAALRLERQDLLFMVSPPLSNGLIALLLRKLRGLPYVFNIQDIYPDAAVSAGIIRNGLLIRLLQRLERAIYHNASGIAVISDGFRDNLFGKGVATDKVGVIYNWIDTNEIVPLPKETAFAREHDLAGKFVVLYSGTIGLISGAEILVECAARMTDCDDVVFLFVGEGVVKDRIQEEAAARSLRNVRFLPFQPRNLLSEVQSVADVSVVTLKKGKGMTSVPSKVLGYMAGARPVVASVDLESDTATLVRRAGCGLVVPPENAEELCAAIRELYEDRARAAACGRSGRLFLENNCGRSRITGQYVRFFEKCAAGGAP